MRYTVASVDAVLEKSNWEVNDQYNIGMIDISQEVAENDQLILNVLAQENIAELALDEVYFIAEDIDYLTVYRESDDRPLLTLCREE